MFSGVLHSVLVKNQGVSLLERLAVVEKRCFELDIRARKFYQTALVITYEWFCFQVYFEHAMMLRPFPNVTISTKFTLTWKSFTDLTIDFIRMKKFSALPVVIKRMRSWLLHTRAPSSNPPSDSQLPHLAIFCWLRPPPWKIMYIVISLINAVKR